MKDKRHFLLNPKDSPTEKDEWQGLIGDSKALALYETAILEDRPLVIITPSVAVSKSLAKKLNYFFGNQKIAVLEFPDWETLPYDRFSPHQDIVSERMQILNLLVTKKTQILIVAVTTLLHKVVPLSFIKREGLLLNRGDEMNLALFRSDLKNSGYSEVQQVLEHGEFAIRGSIIDIFPSGSKTPFRLDLFDNEIDSIRVFDPEDQRSLVEIEQIKLLPAHEYSLEQPSTDTFCNNWLTTFAGDSLTCPIYQKIKEGKPVAGAEYYLQLFFSKLDSLFDYMPADTLIFQYGDLLSHAHSFWIKIIDRHEQLRYDRSFPILPPEKIFLNLADLTEKLQKRQTITLVETKKVDKKKHAFVCFETKKIGVPAKENPFKFLQENFFKTKIKTLVCVGSPGREELLMQQLSKHNLELKPAKSWVDFVGSDAQLSIAVAPLNESFSYKNFAVITEKTLLNSEHIVQADESRPNEQDSAAILKSFTALEIGDPVVHLNYGIGEYLGLQPITTDGHKAEYVTLRYAGDAKIYVPITSLHLINKYLAPKSENVVYNTLGTKRWEKTKNKALEKIRDTAAELLAVYAKRESTTGHAFKFDKTEYQVFADTFPFEPTPDQQRVIAEVLADMRSPRCMDRLVCGDVGFGKTEVALRAAFVATQNNKQVAILAPTTLLVQQHLNTFQDRFRAWPVRIEALSRFNSTAKQSQLISELRAGKIDIIIGTHRLLQKDISFGQIGLLVIDEEHRFGVRQKEQIKKMRANIDILTLTATPIPRTLSFSLAEIRDLSIIATPPAKRLSVKTFVRESEYNQTTKEAISREILRGGQVYFLHNDVATIAQKANELKELLPDAQIAIAHGQMRKQDLEQIMADFYRMRFNVLLCTTIIESGIDVPTANTIIINRADKFGLAQLYQLRGRVGRSHHQAYAYLLIPPQKILTADAKKRLDAFGHMEELGSGFSLATYDLEIRGTGEILGEEQSGHIHSIGYTLYMELLDKTVKSMHDGREFAPETLLMEDVKITLQLPLFIPDNYISNINTRLNIYKRLANVTEQKSIDDLQVELIDRFGLLPEQAKNLIAVTELKLRLKPLGVSALKTTSQYLYLEFIENPKIDPAKLISLIQTSPDVYKLTTPTLLRVKTETKNLINLIGNVNNLIDYII